MDLGLKNTIALVAGSSRGLGYATARQLSLEGCKVVLNGRNESAVKTAAERLQEETGNPVFAVPGDVAAPEQPAKLIAATAEQFGGLDILITNSGGPKPGPFESFDDLAWNTAVELCLMSHVRLIRAALPYLRRSNAASVLTITSVSVKQPIPSLILSNSVRAATVGLTKSLALELGKEGIRFNSILPAYTETERIVDLLGARAKANGTTLEAEIQKQAQESPLGRMATPQEFANAATFLVSPAASYLTGVMLPVDGGMYKGLL